MPSNKETGSQLIESEKWDKPVVVIAGPLGSGKTTLGAYLSNNAMMGDHEIYKSDEGAHAAEGERELFRLDIAYREVGCPGCRSKLTFEDSMQTLQQADIQVVVVEVLGSGDLSEVEEIMLENSNRPVTYIYTWDAQSHRRNSKIDQNIRNLRVAARNGGSVALTKAIDMSSDEVNQIKNFLRYHGGDNLEIYLVKEDGAVDTRVMKGISAHNIEVVANGEGHATDYYKEEQWLNDGTSWKEVRAMLESIEVGDEVVRIKGNAVTKNGDRIAYSFINGQLTAEVIDKDETRIEVFQPSLSIVTTDESISHRLFDVLRPDALREKLAVNLEVLQQQLDYYQKAYVNPLGANGNVLSQFPSADSYNLVEDVEGLVERLSRSSLKDSQETERLLQRFEDLKNTALRAYLEYRIRAGALIRYQQERSSSIKSYLITRWGIDPDNLSYTVSEDTQRDIGTNLGWFGYQTLQGEYPMMTDVVSSIGELGLHTMGLEFYESLDSGTRPNDVRFIDTQPADMLPPEIYSCVMTAIQLEADPSKKAELIRRGQAVIQKFQFYSQLVNWEQLSEQTSDAWWQQEPALGQEQPNDQISLENWWRSSLLHALTQLKEEGGADDR